MGRRRKSFSRRHGLAKKHAGPLVYDEVPELLRTAFLGLLEQDFDVSPSDMRDRICYQLRAKPDPSNWSEYPNIWGEVQSLIYRCEWYKFFDIVEAFGSWFEKQRSVHREEYEEGINEMLEESGMGWVLCDGQLEIRGDEPLENLMESTFETLSPDEFEVATSELSEAWKDLSRRPVPDTSGAVQHSMAALEAVARKVTGNSRATLGDIIRKNPGLFPVPVDAAASKLWGFASNEARHGSEERELTIEEVLLVVGVSSSLATYLARKFEGAAQVGGETK